MSYHLHSTLPLYSSNQNFLFRLLFFYDWTIAVPSFPDAPSAIKSLQRFKTMQPVSSQKLLRQTSLHLIFTLCIGFRSILESNTNFVLFVLVLSLLLVLSSFLIFSTFTHPVGNFDLLRTSVCCAFRLSTLNCTLNAPFLTLL